MFRLSVRRAMATTLTLSFVVRKTDLVQALNIVYNLVNKSIILHK